MYTKKQKKKVNFSWEKEKKKVVKAFLTKVNTIKEETKKGKFITKKNSYINFAIPKS